jgi:hypothetical protein
MSGLTRKLALLTATAALAGGLTACGGGGGDKGNGKKTTDGISEQPIPGVAITDLEKAVAAAGCELRNDKDNGNDHVTTKVTYKTNPPTSGPHNPTPTPDGNYAGQAPPAVENTVHSLEHGRIDIQYRKGLTNQQIGQLETLFGEKDAYHMLLFQNQTNMPYDVAATAWTHAVVCEKFNDKVFDAIRAFRDAYVDKGPEFIP